jgi:SAM-dependent methyltransferase
VAQITKGIRALLSSPYVYTAFQSLMGARKGWVRFVNEFVRPVEGMTLLDIGCGPGDLLAYLPPVNYWGFDISEAYIEHASKRFGPNGRFYCKLLSIADLSTMPKFDLVVASGLLHHMDEALALDFLHLAYEALKPGGRLVTIDPCRVSGQHPLARFLIACDRGQNVRTESGYRRLVEPVFARKTITIRHKVWIPYTHCFMECVRA